MVSSAQSFCGDLPPISMSLKAGPQSLHVMHVQGSAKRHVEASPDLESARSTPSSARTMLTLETAMRLYGLTESESFWEVQQDTRCLVSWGQRHVVVAFRGTASVKNALADLQVCLFVETPICLAVHFTDSVKSVCAC